MYDKITSLFKPLNLIGLPLFGGFPYLFAHDDGAAETPAIDTGDTALMIVCTVLLLLMTLPGLALFYGGLVRVKNLLSVLMHCFELAWLPFSGSSASKASLLKVTMPGSVT